MCRTQPPLDSNCCKALIISTWRSGGGRSELIREMKLPQVTVTRLDSISRMTNHTESIGFAVMLITPNRQQLPIRLYTCAAAHVESLCKRVCPCYAWPDEFDVHIHASLFFHDLFITVDIDSQG